MSGLYDSIKVLVGHEAKGDLIPERANAEKAADQIRANLSGEHGNLNSRIQWNLTLQGFLFAGYAVAFTNTTAAADAGRISFVIPLVGAISSFMTLVGVYAAYRSINAFKRAWLANEGRFKLQGARPFSDPVTSLLGRLSSFVGPFVVLCAWCYLIRWFP
jgi:hypothetical protein